MSITTERKSALINQYGLKVGDTGSPKRFRLRILTERISNLTNHFKTHVKDNHSRRGLLKMVSQRRTLLDYVKKQDEGATRPSSSVWASAADSEPHGSRAPIRRASILKPGGGAAGALDLCESLASWQDRKRLAHAQPLAVLPMTSPIDGRHGPQAFASSTDAG